MKKSYSLSTIVQIIVTASVLICISMIPTKGKAWQRVSPKIVYFELFYGVFMPIVLAVLFCFLRNKGNFHFRIANVKSAESVVRFIIRMAVVVAFLVVQAAAEISRMNYKLANIMGMQFQSSCPI